MNQTLPFLLRHGYEVLLVWVFAEQLGLPIPSLPVLLAIGALAGRRQFSLFASVALAVVATLAADFIWYELGRYRGRSLLRHLCRISLEPDSCVRDTESLFARYRAGSLIIAKFVPGLGTVMPPLAGAFRFRRGRFLVWDAAGAFLWAGAFTGTGYLFSAQIERVAMYAYRLGAWLAVALLLALAAYILNRYRERRRFLRKLRIARITPEELKQKMEAGEEMVIVDLRNSLECENDHVRVPGALHMRPDELEARHQEIPRDRDVVLYCT